jgi:hypothetical protein
MATAAKKPGPRAKSEATKPVSQAVQDALGRLAVVEHMTYPLNGAMQVRLEGSMTSRQLDALRKYLGGRSVA